MKIFKHLLLKVLLLLVLMTTNSNIVKADIVKKYIATYHNLVKQLSKEYSIPVSVITAISIVESGAGKSRNCVLLNNHFGFVGKNNLLKTKGIKTKYKQYATVEASYIDFCKMVSHRKYYAILKGNQSSVKWVTAMAKAGYSTKPDVWKKEILFAIKKYRLDELNEPFGE